MPPYSPFALWPRWLRPTVRPLAAFRSARISILPEVPSTNEFGVDGLDFPVWLGFLAPKRTPQPIVELLNASIRKGNPGCYPARPPRPARPGNA
jgi:tripartite-type tricarboxylate transporter receptor subunit TctC